MRLRKVFYIFALLFLFSVPGTILAEEPTYQVTETQLEQLEAVFSQLKTAQGQQKETLTKQKEQIETLNQQLETSQTAMKNSQAEMQKLQASLNEANNYLQKSAAEAKNTQKRIERQRDTWAVAAIAAAFAVIFH